MIGNDIVDLALARKESNWGRRGFLDKIFTVHEQQLIHTAADPDDMVWLLWSMKESAYKIAVRRSGKRLFAPKKLVCHFNDLNAEPAKGMVHYEGEFLTKSFLTTHYIATVAVSDNHQGYDHIIVPLHEVTFPHQILWEKLKERCAASLSMAEEKFYFHKDETGVPWITIPNSQTTEVKLPLSVSHHGRYGAFVIGKINSQSSVFSHKN